MKSKIYLVVFLVLILIIFVLQNTQQVEFTFLFISFKIPQILLLFSTFALGLIIGILLPDIFKEKKDGKKSSEKS